MISKLVDLASHLMIILMPPGDNYFVIVLCCYLILMILFNITLGRIGSLVVSQKETLYLNVITL